MNRTATKHDRNLKKAGKFLADADIILEYFSNRKGFVEHLEQLLALLLSTELDIHITDKCLKRLKLEHNDKQFEEQVDQFITRAFDQKIIQITPSIRQRARHLRLIDMDSAEELICAADNGCDAIITCNPNNFAGSNLPIWTVESLLLRLSKSPQHKDSEIVFQSAVDDYGNSNELSVAWKTTSELKILKELKETEDRKQLDHAVQALFDGNSPEALTFCSSITRLLRQYRLSGTYQAKDIIAEAYARSVLKIEKGALIQIPLAWLRHTCFNVIREFKRKQTKINKPKLDGDGCSLGGTVIAQFLLGEDLKAIRLAFEQLSLEDQNILQARSFQGRSWQEISEGLVNSNSRPVPPGTARQRGARALIRLRQHYE